MAASKSPQETLHELWDLVVAYAKQETIEPLKSLGRYVAYGIAGGLLLGVGVLFWALAGLRALQTETGTTFTGSWSWAPYAIMVVVLAAGGGITWKARAVRSSER